MDSPNTILSAQVNKLIEQRFAGSVPIFKTHIHYGNEADQYSFYRIPKAFFTDSRFKNVQVEAKVLYDLLLDRMSLSIRNNYNLFFLAYHNFCYA